MSISIPMLITFIIYILGMILIGSLAYRSTNGFDDYILGGRSLSSIVTALSASASDMSGWLLMGLPGAIFLSGISNSWIAIGLIIGAWFNWKIVAARLRIQTEYYSNALTLPDFFTSRFEDKHNILRLISSFIILIFFTIYCSSGTVAGAHLFESIFGINYQTALWVGATTTILYTLLGGFLAVSWTDTVQASLMIFALILTPIIVIFAAGGFSDALMIIKIKYPENIHMFKGINFSTIFSLLGWGLGYFGQPHILTRFMAVNSYHSIRTAGHISMIWMILCLTGAVAVGFFGIAYFQSHPDQAVRVKKNNELVFVELARILFNPWIAGILLSAVLAAIMSTLSCQLLVCSSTLTKDLYKGFFRKKASQKELIWIGRLMVLMIALISIRIAANPENRVLSLVSTSWAGLGAAFGPAVIFSVCWQRMTRNGALAGMIIGTVTVVVWKHFNYFNLYEIIPSFIFASIAILVISLLDKVPSKLSQQHFMTAKTGFNN